MIQRGSVRVSMNMFICIWLVCYFSISLSPAGIESSRLAFQIIGFVSGPIWDVWERTCAIRQTKPTALHLHFTYSLQLERADRLQTEKPNVALETLIKLNVQRLVNQALGQSNYDFIPSCEFAKHLSSCSWIMLLFQWSILWNELRRNVILLKRCFSYDSNATNIWVRVKWDICYSVTSADVIWFYMQKRILSMLWYR